MPDERVSDFCSDCGATNTGKKRFCPECGASLIKNESPLIINPSAQKIESKNKDQERIVIIAGVLLLAILVIWLVILPTIQSTITNAQNKATVDAYFAKIDADAAATTDFNSILMPSGTDLKIVGSWGFKNSQFGKTIQFNSDGTFNIKYYEHVGDTQAVDGTGVWGRMKGNNNLIYRINRPARYFSELNLDFDVTKDKLTVNSIAPQLGTILYYSECIRV